MQTKRVDCWESQECTGRSAMYGVPNANQVGLFAPSELTSTAVTATPAQLLSRLRRRPRPRQKKLADSCHSRVMPWFEAELCFLARVCACSAFERLDVSDVRHVPGDRYVFDRQVYRIRVRIYLRYPGRPECPAPVTESHNICFVWMLNCFISL